MSDQRRERAALLRHEAATLGRWALVHETDGKLAAEMFATALRKNNEATELERDP